MIGRLAELIRAAGPAAAPPFARPRIEADDGAKAGLRAGEGDPAPRHPLPTTRIACLSVAFLVAGCHNPQSKRHALEQLIVQAIPNGSSISQVITFLDSRHIAHYGYDPKAHRIDARAKLGGTIVHQDLHVVFHFDADGKLIRKEFEEWLTGP